MQEAISKSVFKAKALELFREVEKSGETIIVTDHGKPTIEVRPYSGAQISPLDLLQGSVTRFEDPMAPIADDAWEALSDRS